jgi:hypothetical protein
MAPRARDGTVFFGLQDDYAFLEAVEDERGRNFHELGLDDREKSPLTARNQSILAHGFDPISDKVYQTLWSAALRLSETDEAALPTFPRFGRM